MNDKPNGKLLEPYPPTPQRIKLIRARKPAREKLTSEKRGDKPASGKRYFRERE